MPTFFRFLVVALWVVGSALVCAQDDKIDWARAEKLHKRAQAGEKLNAEDAAYYDKAKAARAAGKGQKGRGQVAPAQVDTSKLVPLTELGDGREAQCGGCGVLR